MASDSESGMHTVAQYVDDNWSMLAALVCVIALIVGIYLVDRRWRRRQIEKEKVTGFLKQSHSFSLTLVRHFMPSFQVHGCAVTVKHWAPRVSATPVEDVFRRGSSSVQGKHILHKWSGDDSS